MSKALELELKSALLSTGLIQPVSSKTSKGRIEVLSRIVPGQDKGWLEAVTQLLEMAEATGTDLHVCRRYLMKDGKLVFGWHLSIDSPRAGMQEAVEKITKVLALVVPSLNSPTPQPEVPTPRPPFQRPAAPGQHPSKLAVSRAPTGEANVDPEPQGYEFKETVVVDKVDEDGKRHIETVVPLPHVHKDHNVPSKPVYNESLGKFVGGGKGARYTGS